MAYFVIECDFIDYEVVQKEKTGHRYIYYHFRDKETGHTHLVYDHSNSKETAIEIERNRHRLLRVEGHITVRGSHEYLNLGRWGIIIDGKLYDPLTMIEGYRVV